MALLTDPKKAGTVLVVLASGDWVEPQRTRFRSVGETRPRFQGDMRRCLVLATHTPVCCARMCRCDLPYYDMLC